MKGTSFRLQSQDGAWIIGRSMELGLLVEIKVMLVPRKYPLATTRADTHSIFQASLSINRTPLMAKMHSLILMS